MFSSLFAETSLRCFALKYRKQIPSMKTNHAFPIFETRQYMRSLKPNIGNPTSSKWSFWKKRSPKNKCCAESCTGRKGKCSNTRLGNLWICKSFKFKRERSPTARCRKLHCFWLGTLSQNSETHTHTKRLKFPSKNLLARKSHPIFSTKKISTNTTRGKNPSIATLELWKLRHLLEIHWGFTSALHPGKFTWNLQISQLKRKVIFQTSVFGFHDHFPGCTLKNHRSTRTSALVTQPRLPTRTSDRSSYCESVSPSEGTYHWEGVESEGEVLWIFSRWEAPMIFKAKKKSSKTSS